MNEHNALILSAGQVPNELGGLFGNICSGMMPLNNKTAISWILDELIQYEFTNYYIAVDYKKELIINFIEKKYPELNIEFIEVDRSLPPGNSIVKAVSQVQHGPTTIILGDTIFSDKLNFENSFVLGSSQFSAPEKWCLVEADQSGDILSITEKENIPDSSNHLALIGLYHFQRYEQLKQACNLPELERVEISQIISAYNEKEKIKIIESNTWIDLGHLDNYYQAKFKSKKTRYFNSLSHDLLLGTITKRSKNVSKFRNEINWYLNLPNQLKPLSPRIFDYSLDENPFVTMEYYGYPTLAEIFLFSDLDLRTWDQLSSRIIQILSLFTHHKNEISEEQHRDIFIAKTENRINSLLDDDPTFTEIFNYDEVIINGSSYINFNMLKQEVTSRLNHIIDSRNEYSCVIHGDLCFSNILVDLNSGITRLIDPRGTWGDVSIYGDIRYDLAKLRHSASGCYDYIVNDLFTVERNENSFNFEVFNNSKQIEIAKYFDYKFAKAWNLDQIKLIEALLFLSMIPLHNDKPKRQLAMYCQGIIKLNNIIKESNDT